MVKELVPIVVAVALWGKLWSGTSVMCRCDNQAVVAVITSRTSHDKRVMHLLRCLFFLEASSDCHLVASHIPGRHNELADDLSRNHLYIFLFPESSPLNITNPTLGTSASLVSATRLDFGVLEESVQRYFEAGLAESTRKVYHSGVKKLLYIIKYHKPSSYNPAHTLLLCCVSSKYRFFKCIYKNLPICCSAYAHQ